MASTTPLGERWTENWTGALHSEAVSCMLPVGRKTKMEIPVRAVLNHEALGCLDLWEALHSGSLSFNENF
jgi:hypothetical protein